VERGRDVERARLLSAVSVVLGAIVAVAAIWLGIDGGSLSMIGFGVDAAIDASASVVLIWRFTIESRNGAHGLRAEELAERLVGIVLLASATGLLLGALRALAFPEPIHGGTAQLILLVASLIALPPLAIAKRRVADRLSSNALRKDALLTGAAAVLALVALLAGEAATSFGLWWADAVGSIVIALVLGREGWVAIRPQAGPA
jgi:divalent metal cation (Fe/Co/Zn/Cd) transporter